MSYKSSSVASSRDLTQASGRHSKSTRRTTSTRFMGDSSRNISYRDRKKKSKGVSKSIGIVVLDPLTDESRDPEPLTKKDFPQRDSSYTRNQSSMGKSMGSVTSGRLSPSMSEISDAAVSVSFSSFRNQAGSSHLSSGTPSRTGSPTMSHLSEDDFLFQSPAYGYGDDGTEEATPSVLGDGDLGSVENRQMTIESEPEVELTDGQKKNLMNSDFIVTLKETETFILFERLDESVANDSPDIDLVQERNALYLSLKEKKIKNKDNYQDNEMQTIPSFSKNKYSDIPKSEVEEASVSVSAWEIYDEYKALREKEEKEREEMEQITMAQTKEDGDGEEEDEEDEEEEEDDLNDRHSIRSHISEKNSIYKDPAFMQSLMILERMIVQNVMQPYQEEYLDFTEEESSIYKIQSQLGSKPSEFKHLWTYESPIPNKNVNCMCWNSEIKEMLAVGYGNIDFVGEKDGLICIWMVKNPTFPERIIKIENKGVSALSFSRFNPNLLSVGYNDGSVALFDIRSRDNTPVIETSKHHTGTVWDLKWVDRGKDHGEMLHSVGVDGRVNAWSIKKGLDCTEIMRLRRQGTNKGDGVISRDSGGMCLDFDPHDSGLYIVGTEDGTIQKCSCSYNEQTLQTFVGHTGPVYRVQWNPFNRNSFISCSADWTIRVWNTEKQNPLEFKIEPYTTKQEKRSCVMTDVAWSPYKKDIFATTSITGDVEIWDINFSTIKPRFSKSHPEVQYNCLLWAQDSPALLVGDSKGNVEVLKPVGLYS